MPFRRMHPMHPRNRIRPGNPNAPIFSAPFMARRLVPAEISAEADALYMMALEQAQASKSAEPLCAVAQLLYELGQKFGSERFEQMARQLGETALVWFGIGCRIYAKAIPQWKRAG